MFVTLREIVDDDDVVITITHDIIDDSKGFDLCRLGRSIITEWMTGGKGTDLDVVGPAACCRSCCSHDLV